VITITGFGPNRDSFPPGNNQANHQPSGRMTALTLAADGSRLYGGSFAGVWRSDDAGQNWSQLAWPQPGLGIVEAQIPGALLAPHIFDLVASPSDVNVVLASALDSQFIQSKDGIYRTADGGFTWTLVLPATIPCNIAFAPDKGQLAYAATGGGIAISQDGGATWKNVSVGGSVFHVAVAPLEANGKRRVYALGNSRIFGSLDGGQTSGLRTSA
jgi:photosystem II stability/assembly factor-like uncharacterized protein